MNWKSVLTSLLSLYHLQGYGLRLFQPSARQASNIQNTRLQVKIKLSDLNNLEKGNNRERSKQQKVVGSRETEFNVGNGRPEIEVNWSSNIVARVNKDDFVSSILYEGFLENLPHSFISCCLDVLK